MLPSEKVPVAANRCVLPNCTDGFAGVTAIETSAAGVTVKTVELEMPVNVAEIVLVP